MVLAITKVYTDATDVARRGRMIYQVRYHPTDMNWIRYVATKSGLHGPKDNDGNRESHIGLRSMRDTGGPVSNEVKRELERRNKRRNK